MHQQCLENSDTYVMEFIGYDPPPPFNRQGPLFVFHEFLGLARTAPTHRIIKQETRILSEKKNIYIMYNYSVQRYAIIIEQFLRRCHLEQL